MKLKLITILLFFVYCTETIEPADCNGVSGGNSVEDNCGICDNDPSNDCVQDCNGEWGGNEILDINGVCCSNWEQDDCNYCDSTNIFSGGLLPNGNCSCDGDILDGCGVCAGNGAPCLDFSLTSIQTTIIIGDTLAVTAQVDNADTLFALSFKLEYNSGIFVPIDEPTFLGSINVGTLFMQPFLASNPAFNLDGEINVAIGEQGTVSHIISGSACIIKLIAIGTGLSNIEISGLHMIEANGDPIEGLSTVTVDGLQVIVSD